MGYIFDGPNRKIILTTGTVSVDIDDMYSRWIDWFLTSDNSKYLMAMRNVGGDMISSTKNLGLTFFLINNWRIVPQSADHRLVLNGNLVTDPTGFSPIDTIPGYSIIVEYSVSNLVDSTLAQMPEIEYASYNGGVTVDINTQYSGIVYPVGTPRQPVNNLADALAIATNRGFTKFYINSSMSIGDGGNFKDFEFIGENPNRTILTIDNTAQVDNCEFKFVTISGILDGGSTIDQCRVGNINYIDGIISNSILLANSVIRLSGVKFANIINCSSGRLDVVSDIPPIIDMCDTGTSLAVRNFNGIVKLINKYGPENVDIDLNSGHVIVDQTITGGTMQIRGVGNVEDNSTGIIIDTSGLLNSEIITTSVWNESGAELDSIPATTSTLKSFIQYLFQYFKNKKTVTNTKETMFKDDGSELGSAVLSDDGTTFTKNEMV